MEKKMLGPEEIEEAFKSMRERIATTRVSVHRRLSVVAANMGGEGKLPEPEVSRPSASHVPQRCLRVPVAVLGPDVAPTHVHARVFNKHASSSLRAFAAAGRAHQQHDRRQHSAFAASAARRPLGRVCDPSLGRTWRSARLR